MVARIPFLGQPFAHSTDALGKGGAYVHARAIFVQTDREDVCTMLGFVFLALAEFTAVVGVVEIDNEVEEAVWSVGGSYRNDVGDPGEDTTSPSTSSISVWIAHKVQPAVRAFAMYPTKKLCKVVVKGALSRICVTKF